MPGQGGHLLLYVFIPADEHIEFYPPRQHLLQGIFQYNGGGAPLQQLVYFPEPSTRITGYHQRRLLIFFYHVV